MYLSCYGALEIVGLLLLLSICQQFVGLTTPKRRGMSEIPHPHAAHLPYLPEPRQDCDRIACQFLVRSLFRGGVGSISYITLELG